MYKFVNESSHSVTYVKELLVLRFILSDKTWTADNTLSIHIYLNNAVCNNDNNILILKKDYASYDEAAATAERLQALFESTLNTKDDNHIITFNY